MKYYIVDAFCNEVFRGNQAGVCILENELTSETMQKIACENNLSETAFVLKKGNDYLLRWFTPSFEINLCGHATLASAFVMCNYENRGLKEITFSTLSGDLNVIKKDDMFEMEMPYLKPDKIEITQDIIDNSGAIPKNVYSQRDLYLELDNEKQIKNYNYDYEKLEKLDKWLGIVITAKGDNCDFVSRYFCPELKAEDAVTGSSHSSLIPLWSEKLNKKVMTARQLSQRGGILYCEDCDNSVKISGNAVLYLKGTINI